MRLGYKIGIFIPFLLVLLMSHNSSALDLTINLNDYENLNYAVSPDYYDYVITNTSGTVVRTCSKTYTCAWNNNEQLRVAKTDKSFNLEVGDIVTYNLTVYSPSNLAGVEYVDFRQLNPGGGVSNLYFHKVSDFQALGPHSYNETCTSQNTTSQCSGLYISDIYKYSATYEIANIITASGSKQLGSFNQNTVDGVLYGSPSSGNSLMIGISGFNVYRKNKTAVNQEQEEATQEASDESQDVADENSESEQSSNLIGILQDFLTSLTSLSPSNCNVDLAFPSSLGGTMSVNICQNKDKAGTIISVFGSITLVIFYLPLAMKLLSMIYNEIRSFTNG